MTLASQGIRFGAHTPIQSGGDLLEAINLWEQQVDRRMDIVNHFRKWGAPSGQLSKDTLTSLRQASGQGRAPMVTWMPCTKDITAGPYTLDSIANGVHDTYITEWADAVRGLGTPIYLRLMHEMNGDWYPWCGDPEAFVRAWRRVVSRFTAAGARNAKFVWCVNASDQPATNRLEDYWPGDGWVDVIGVDGYNNYGGWRPFSQIIRPAYDRVCRLSTILPIWICETASGEGDSAIWPGTDTLSKPAWISGLFATSNLERVQAVCWFDERTPRFDWRSNSTGRALIALRQELREATGYTPPPGPYVPPVPDRVTATCTGPGQITVGWRQVASFCRGYTVRVTDRYGYSRFRVVPKPATSATIDGITVGDHTVTVTSYTLVRVSAPSSPPVPVTVTEAF